MTTIIERFNKIKLNINSLKMTNPVNLVAVSKTFSIDHIKPLIDYGTIILVKIKYKKQYQNGKT